jgi:hypothetical protein
VHAAAFHGGAKEELKVIEVFGSLQHALALARARNGGVKICTNFGPPKRPKPSAIDHHNNACSE